MKFTVKYYTHGFAFPRYFDLPSKARAEKFAVLIGKDVAIHDIEIINNTPIQKPIN